MTTKQRAFLRSMAQTLDPIFQVGKGGINDNLIKQLIETLEVRELIKINMLNTTPEDKKTTAEEIAKRTGAELVQVIGNKLTLYKKSSKKPIIELP